MASAITLVMSYCIFHDVLLPSHEPPPPETFYLLLHYYIYCYINCYIIPFTGGPFHAETMSFVAAPAELWSIL